MPLSEKLISNALLGTKHAAQTASADAPQAKLLLDALVSDWREKCGYVPGYDHRPMPSPAQLPTLPLLNERAMQDFHLMRKGYFGRALPEWLIDLAAARRRIDDAYMPHLLVMGQKKPELRPHISLVLDETGVWLAREVNNQNWKWVFSEKAMDWTVEKVRVLGQERESAVMDHWKARPGDNATSGLSILKPYTHVWTDSFTRAFLETMTKLRWERRDWSRISSLNLIAELSYSFPLTMSGEVTAQFARWITRMQFESSPILDGMRAVFDFRTAMLATLTEQD